MQGYAAQFSKEISNLLWRVPRELLLLLKTNDCLRSVDHALGQVSFRTQACCVFCVPAACMRSGIRQGSKIDLRSQALALQLMGWHSMEQMVHLHHPGARVM